jgi:hypothetical protein
MTRSRRKCIHETVQEASNLLPEPLGSVGVSPANGRSLPGHEASGGPSRLNVGVGMTHIDTGHRRRHSSRLLYRKNLRLVTRLAHLTEEFPKLKTRRAGGRPRARARLEAIICWRERRVRCSLSSQSAMEPPRTGSSLGRRLWLPCFSRACSPVATAAGLTCKSQSSRPMSQMTQRLRQVSLHLLQVLMGR